MSCRERTIESCLAWASLFALGIPAAQASGPGAAAHFAILGAGAVYIQTTTIGGAAGDVGGYSVELTDKVRVKGNAIAGASYSGALELGDNSMVRGKCVTGGGSVSIVPNHPAKCLKGIDTSGGDPLLAEWEDATGDADSLADALSALVPTSSLPEIDVPTRTHVTLPFDPGVNVVAVSGRFLVESSGTLTIRAPANATVTFLVSGGLTTQSKGKIALAGGIKPDAVVYVVADDVLLGVGSSIKGTVLSTSGSCLAYEKVRLAGALMCDGGIAFSMRVAMTFAPLRATFPNP